MGLVWFPKCSMAFGKDSISHQDSIVIEFIFVNIYTLKVVHCVALSLKQELALTSSSDLRHLHLLWRRGPFLYRLLLKREQQIPLDGFGFILLTWDLKDE